MRSAADVIEALDEAFPQRAARGEVAPHECEECAAIRATLTGHTWGVVPNSFAEEFSGSLALLSSDAYNAYLPVWLRASVENPNGEAASMVAINLSHEPKQIGFTPAQARALVAAVEFVAGNNLWGTEDPVNLEHVAAVRAAWASYVA